MVRCSVTGLHATLGSCGHSIQVHGGDRVVLLWRHGTAWQLRLRLALLVRRSILVCCTLLKQAFVHIKSPTKCLIQGFWISKTNFLAHTITETPDEAVQQLRVAGIWYGQSRSFERGNICIHRTGLLQRFQAVTGFLTFINHCKLI